MRVTEFETHYKHLKQRIDDLMINKAGEYADDTDRLANFKQTTSLLNTNELKVAINYWLKHVGSIVKIADDIDKGIYPTPELLEEKCGDLVAYSYLMYACGLEILEQAQNKNGSVASQKALESPSDTKDDTTIVLPNLDKNFFEKQNPLNFDNTSDSITLSKNPSCKSAVDDINLSTIL